MLDASRRHLEVRAELVSKPLDLLLRIFENATSFLLAFEINQHIINPRVESWSRDRARRERLGVRSQMNSLSINVSDEDGRVAHIEVLRQGVMNTVLAEK